MSERELGRKEICERYEKLYTGAVADILDEKGYWNQALGRELRPILPAGRAAGFAFPVLGEAIQDRTHDCRSDILKFLDAVPPYSMIVSVPGEDKNCSHWGEFMSLVARNQGCRGAVVDGGVRDTEMIIQSGFQVFGTYFRPVSSVGRWRPIHFGHPVVMHGVEIRPGDLILGDIDGVVVVPALMVEEVLSAAEECYRAERSMKEELRAGKSMQEVFEKYGRW
ncbi:MAG: RraA family protein [Deltaproteobacteria bacterium]|nr:RraA family protein [Deltaproteobacteria bacterium]MBW2308237.1 RraA family protein [Deltaproteobacteria bacterium]